MRHNPIFILVLLCSQTAAIAAVPLLRDQLAAGGAETGSGVVAAEVDAKVANDDGLLTSTNMPSKIAHEEVLRGGGAVHKKKSMEDFKR